MNRNKLLIGSGGFVIALVAALMLLDPGVRQHGPETRADTTGDQSAGDANSSARTPGGGTQGGSGTRGGGDAGLAAYAAREPAPLPPSLGGTAVDGRVRADDRGRLIVDAGVRDLFEYYLSTLGSASLEQIRVWVARHLRNHLPAKAAEQGWALFQRYLGYRRSLESIPRPGPDAGLNRVEAVMQQRNALRREKLGRRAAEAFFAAEEAYDQYMLRQRRIEANGELTAEEKQRRREQARAELPEPMREIRQETTGAIRAREHVKQMRAEGASEAEVRAWREANLGAEVADRLEYLEQRRAQWEQRYQAYREAREQLDTRGLAEPEREVALQRLRQKHFDKNELRRVEALDRLRAEQAGERPDE